jgi:hypothetical protein
MLDGTRCNGRQERLCHLYARKRRLEMRDVGLHRGMADISEGSRAEDLPGVGRGAAEAAATGEVVREFPHVTAGDHRRPLVRGGRALFEPAEPLAGVGRKTPLRELAIVDDVEAGRELLLDDLGDRTPDPRGEGCLVIRSSFILGDEQVP